MSTSNPHARSNYLVLSPSSARALSVASMGGLYLWFALQFLVSVDRPVLRIAAGLLALLSIGGCAALFLCNYSFIANAPNALIDERELAERNGAYVRAFQYVSALLLMGCLGADLSAPDARLLAKDMVGNYFTLAFFTSLVMPAAVLAWQDSGHAGD